MTERNFDRIATAWLDLMPSEAPDRTIDVVLTAVERTPQVRRLGFRLPWRPQMNRLTILAATAALLVAGIAGAMLLSSGRAPSVPVPSPVASPTEPQPTPRARIAAPPQTMWGDWIADVPAIPAIGMPVGMLQLSIDWQDGLEVWIQTIPDYRQLLSSAPLEAPAGELRVRSNSTSSECVLNTEGRYNWTRSEDGMFLTVEVIEDACPTRATVFARTWVHSLGAVNDGGPGVAYGVTPMTQVTLPSGQRYGASGGEQSQEIKTFGDSQPFRAFVVVRNPGGFGAPCSDTDPQKVSLTANTADAFVRYVEGLPGATVSTEPATIGGRTGVRLDVAIDPGLECRADGMQAFHPENVADEFTWAFTPGEVESLYILQMDAATTFLLWYQGSAAEEQAVLESIEFIDALPVP